MLTVEKVESLLRPVLEGADLEILDLKVMGSRGRVVFYLILDHRYRSVGVDELTKVSRRFEDKLDMDEDIPREYALEVTSPGVDHPLKYEWEFAKNVGRKLKLSLELDPDDKPMAEKDRPAPAPPASRKKLRQLSDEQVETFEVELKDARDGVLTFKDGRVVSMDRVVEARVMLPW